MKITELTAKSAPVAADLQRIVDTEDGNSDKKVTLGGILQMLEAVSSPDIEITTGVASLAVSRLKYATKSVPKASVLTLYSASPAFELIAAPGAGKSLVPIQAAVHLTNVTAAFAAGGVPQFKLGGVVVNTVACTTAMVIQSGATTQKISFVPLSGLAEGIASNVSLTLSCLTQDFTTGEGNLVVHLWYRVIDLA